MKKTYPLTPFGNGIQLSEFTENDKITPAFVNDLIEKYQFVVFKHFLPTVENVQAWFAEFGELVENKKRVNNNALVLDGSKEQKEVLGGKGRMPLHCDGLLMNESVKLVCIYCVDSKVESGGRTYVSNNEEVWNRLPEEIKQVAVINGVEIMPCDTSYYLKNEPVWYKFSGVQERNGKQYLNAGLHYHPNEPSSWKIRFSNLSEETSYQYFNEIERIAEDESLTYYHQWEPCDLLLIDNVSAMHGREAFTGMRKLVQFQVRN